MGRSRTPKAGTGSGFASVDNMPPFLAAINLKPFISDELRQSTMPILFKTKDGRRAYGYKAEILPMVCDVYLKLRDAGNVPKTQKHIVEACDILMRGFAIVGIIALVDEATGYQEDRAKDELQIILKHYISEALLPWIQKFPNEFFKQVYRLHGWEYKPETVKRPQYIGKLINKYVYEKLPLGVLGELRRKNPVTEKGYRKYRHFQFLTADTGNPHLDRQIMVVTTLMQAATDKNAFEEMFSRVFDKEYQLKLAL